MLHKLYDANKRVKNLLSDEIEFCKSCRSKSADSGLEGESKSVTAL